MLGLDDPRRFGNGKMGRIRGFDDSRRLKSLGETPTYSLNKNGIPKDLDMDVSENNGTPKSSILIGCSIRNHPFWGTPIFGNTHMS